MDKKNFFVNIDSERCKGCSLCIANCPKKILKLSKTTNTQGLHYSICTNQEDCIGCQTCTDFCPELAIEIYIKEKANV